MINRALGIVIKVIQIEDDLELCSVLVDEIEVKAYSFPKEVGHIITNDKVILNTTAVDLCLGSGGFHFIMGRYSSNMIKYIGKGHIMKLRYTPFQLKVCAVEEEDSPYQNKILGVTSIKGVPVIAGSLHSMLIPCVCGIKSVNNALRIGYIMTDGGALPIKISEAVRKLKVHKYLCGTVTVGHSYGGDLEAINLYSGIIAAKEILQAHIIIVLMGPGIVGTGTIWGNTALEVGQIINAVTTLEGTSYTIPRISFSDKRERHFGVSHHTITALSKVALGSTNVVLPKLSLIEKERVFKQLNTIPLNKHQIIVGNGQRGIKKAKDIGLKLSHMGREYEDDKVFFLTASAVGEEVAEKMTNHNI